MEQERRRHARYQKADLTLDVARPGIKGVLSVKPTSECLNFCLTGLQFGSNKPFIKGERLVLDLSVYDVAVREIKAQVVNCHDNGDGTFCTGVRFCFEAKSMHPPEISHAILQIEDRLRCAEQFPFSSATA